MVIVSNRSFRRVRTTIGRTRAMRGPITVVTGAIGNGNISCVRGTIG